MPPLLAAAIVVLLESLCFTTQFPVVSYYVQQLGGGGGWVGLMFLLVAGPKVLSNPLWGALSDRIGRRPVLVVNTLGTLVGSALWALAPQLGSIAPPLAWLALSRGIVGFFGGQAGLAQAIAADSSPLSRRAAAMGTLGGAFALSLAVGPLVGGLVAERWSHASVGWLCAGLQVVSLGVISLLLRETGGAGVRAAAPPSQEAWRSEADRGIGAEVWGWIAVTFVLTSGISVLNSTYGLLCEGHYGFTVQQTGYALALLGFIAAIVQGGVVRLLNRRLHERTITVMGLVTVTWGLAMLAKPPPVWGLWAGTILYAVGIALASPCILAMMTQATPDERQGSVAGVSQGATALGRGLGAGAGGWLYELYLGPRIPYVLAAAVAFLALFLVLLMPGVRSARRARGGG